MVSVNDPWRERLLFQPFAIGVAIGCVALTAASLVDFARLELHRFAFVFLMGALGLSVLLLVFGSGPGRSGVKVNLFGVQPVEAIRPLIALFLAGYFGRRWEWLRELAEPLARQHAILKRLHLPRVADLIPVAIGMALVLLFFFFQHDLGPALVLGCTFLVTYSVARDRWGLAALGLATLVGAFTAAYFLGYPSTVVKRIDMWHSPWDNGVSGGDQVAHALWGLASGGLFGGGLSETSPRYIPPARTIWCSPASARSSASPASRWSSCCSARSWCGRCASRGAPISPTWRCWSSGWSRRSPRRRC